MAFTLHMIDSFDVGTDPGLRWTPATAFIGAGGRGGTQRLMTGSGTSGVGSVLSPTLPSANIRTTGVAFKLSPLSATQKTIVRLQNNTVTHVEIRAIPSSGAGSLHNIALYRSTTFVEWVAFSVAVETWYHLCLKVELSPTAGRVIVLLDGAQTHSNTYPTQNGATTTTDRVSLLGVAQTEYDDFYTGASDTLTADDMPGDRRVVAVAPASAGDQTDLSVVGAATNWEATASHDGDSSFVWSRTPGEYDLYGVAPFDRAVLAVDAVVPFAVARKDDAGSRTLRLVTKSGATTTESSDIALNEVYQYYAGSPLLQNPDTSSAWDQSSLEALQIGPKVQS